MIDTLVVVVAVLFVAATTLEKIRNKRNPLPLMSNDDKRFIEAKNVKTRKMYECIKR